MPSAHRTKRLPDVAELQRRVRVALGQDPGDLLLRGGTVVNVFTERVEPANVITSDGWIAGVGRYDWQALEVVDLAGEAIMPGLIDAHMHLESTLLLPGELAKLIVPRGTTTVIADPHEIANVAGVAGIEMLMDAAKGVPVDVFFMVPSCVPASDWESSGATLDAEAVAALLNRPGILGLAEMMNFPGVLGTETEVMKKITYALEAGVRIDGHAPGVTGRELMAYVAAGIRSDHESTTVEEAVAKADLGMLVQVREGSSARNLDTFLPLMREGKLGDWCLATDDIHVDDLMDRGHLDALLRRVVSAGVTSARTLRHASLVPARHYGLTDRGAVAPGYRADLFVADDLTALNPRMAVKDGRIVARGSEYLGPEHAGVPEGKGSVHLGALSESAFELRPSGSSCPTIAIVPDQIVTRREDMAARIDPSSGRWVFDAERDVALVTCIERHRATGRVGLGLVRGFGLRRAGALGSSVAHDAHNLVLAGTHPRELLICAKALEEAGGGFVVVSEGVVVARLPLAFGGIVSTRGFPEVRRQLDEVIGAARALGCTLPAPFGTLSFLSLSVIPELRITDRGLLDVNRQELLTL